MALRQRKPTSPGRRFQTVSDFADITKTLPEKSLLDSKPKTGGATTTVARPRVTAGRSQAAVPHHRLQAQQGRHSGARRGH